MMGKGRGREARGWGKREEPEKGEEDKHARAVDADVEDCLGVGPFVVGRVLDDAGDGAGRHLGGPAADRLDGPLDELEVSLGDALGGDAEIANDQVLDGLVGRAQPALRC